MNDCFNFYVYFFALASFASHAYRQLTRSCATWLLIWLCLLFQLTILPGSYVLVPSYVHYDMNKV